MSDFALRLAGLLKSIGDLLLGDPAPVLKLPYDILLDIFKVAADAYNSGTDELGMGPLIACYHPGLQGLAVLCSRMPSSLVDVYYIRRMGDNLAPLLARTAPAAVPRSSTFCPGSFEFPLPIPLLNGLRFTGDWDDIPISGFRGGLPRLEILELPCTSLYESLQFQLAPRLHTLRTAQITSVDSNRLWDLIPCAQIRTLVIWNSCDLDLVGFTNLTYLECISMRRGWETDSAPLVLKHLRTWYIDHQASGPGRHPEVAEMLDHFTTPTLESLEISYLTDPSHLCSFLDRSRCALTHLALRRSSIRIGEMVKILEVVPALERLLIDDGYIPTVITNKFFDSLTISSSTGHHVLVPALRELRIRGRFMFQGPKVLDMLQSRVGINLEVVKLVVATGAIAELDLLRLKAFDGIRVSVEELL
ncbi:hypothetical protein FB45DRAFT_1117133 [Roridomyces roridus]|uniref:F-box domain-containing protein n=1 Tax=Roridomyces roridus TaxID=1738132 RepID=A0AAD7B747_9AGAR|nr:hypothetical protein FB45DRAFT_1117133 [Roridomyces roridus]